MNTPDIKCISLWVMLVGTWSLLVLWFSIYNIYYYAAIVSVEATDVTTAA